MAEKTLNIPDIGDFDGVDVIEILVKPGDAVEPETPLVTLESDKATMDIPAPEAGIISKLLVKLGDKVRTGDPLVVIDTAASASAAPTDKPEVAAAATETPEPAATPDSTVDSAPEITPEPAPAQPVAATPPSAVDETRFSEAHASPSVRRFARELGVDLGRISGSGRKGRIMKEDVQAFVKQVMTRTATEGGSGLNIAPWPEIDFAAFGPIETRTLTKINRLTGQYLHRNWAMIPHVTQFDEADITELEDFRKSMVDEYREKGIKITLLTFLMKALVSALKEFPRFNSSLDIMQQHLILKKYFHIGIAVDTVDGLVVPVVRDVDRKTLVELASELGEISNKARDKKLSPADMQGGCITISSLGGIGGTAFTPIVNAPEVAILGVSRAAMKPVWNGEEFEPRLTLPLSLSYDHRVIDGADGARFTSYLARVLSDTRRLLL